MTSYPVKTYELTNGATPGIRCLICGLTSFNTNDILHHYCGNCHIFHDDPRPPAKPEGPDRLFREEK